MTTVIIKEKTPMIEQIKEQIGAVKSGLVIGDLQTPFAQDMLRGLERALSQNEGKRRYCILVYSDIDPTDPRVIQTKIITMSVAQMDALTKRLNHAGLLGTMAFGVNNRRGVVKKIWILPHDIKTAIPLSEGSPATPEIYEYAKRSLICNS